jgi:1,4-dihydroxy-2-naphthoyl-CoA hydrolase
MAATNPEITVTASADALKGTFPGDLGIELLEIGDTSVRGRMRVDRRHLHPGGYVHGGCWVALADTVAAWGTLRHLLPGRGFTTAELKMNVLGAGRAGDELIGVGELLHAGARTQVWEVRVYRNQPDAGERDRGDGAGRDEAGASRRPVANFVCTQMII